MKSFLKILPAFLLMLVLATPAFAQNKIATINLSKVFENYWKHQQAKTALNARRASLEKELKVYMDDYKKLQDDYNKAAASASDQSVTAEEREKRKVAAETKLAEIKSSETTIRTFEESARDQIDTQIKRMRESLLGDIRTAINAKAKAANYTLVLDAPADNLNPSAVVLYSNGENDLTDEILKQLNAGAPASSLSTDAPNAADSKPNEKK